MSAQARAYPVEHPAEPEGEGVVARATAELEGMLEVSRLAGRGLSLAQLLDRIAAATAAAVRADSAAVLLMGDADGPIRLAGRWGLSPGYVAVLEQAPALRPGRGPAGIAVQRGGPFAIADTEAEARFAPWRGVARSEGYRSLASVPLPGQDGALGALTVYRRETGEWSTHELELLGFFGEHAASAIRTGRLIDRQARHVHALTRVVQGLREQTHEHANHLHALRGLLALGATTDALRFLEELEAAHHVAYESVAAGVEQPIVAGTLLAETAAALRRGITLEIDEGSHLRALPRRLPEPDAVTILGNLLENAFDAVAPLSVDRRRVTLTIGGEGGTLRVRVRDHGPGIDAADRARILDRGVTSKAGHAGVGLALVRDAVAAARGTLTIVAAPAGGPGTCVEVFIPA